MLIEENIPLAPLTTFGIGGPASYFARAKSASELKQALAYAADNKQSVFILGGGSNILVNDKGFKGLVIKIEITGIETQRDGEKTIVVASAGESWDGLVRYAVENKLWGMENLSGIPGTVGGAIAGNIGAYGQALSQTLAWVETLDTHTGDIKKVNASQCGFGYRESIFKHDNGRHIILRGAFALTSAATPDFSYKDLREIFKDSKAEIGIIRTAVLAIRAGKFPDLAKEGTAGSFFKNPIVSGEEAVALKERYPQMPVFDMPETTGIKIPLAWILDKVLNLRGARKGRARLFEQQPLVIVAGKNSDAEDVKKLSEDVERIVKENIGIVIEREVKIL